jgi:hypothetical protein
MANTTNYNWETPDDTDLVKDGAAAIRTLGSSIDTTTKALNPETTLGDIAYRSSTSNTNTRLAIGSAGQVLTVAAGVPSWASPSDQTPLTTKGDVFTFSTVDARLGVGANGTVLTADSAETTGLKWATPAAGGSSLTEITSGSLPTGVATLTLSSGLSGYTDLRLVVRDIFCASNAYLQLRVNADTGNNYGYNQFSNTPVDTSGFNADNVRSEIFLNASTIYNADKNNFYTITFNDYANTSSYKTIYSQNVIRNGSDSFFAIEPTWGAYFGGTGAITSITIFAGSNFSGGTYILYGVK